MTNPRNNNFLDRKKSRDVNPAYRLIEGILFLTILFLSAGGVTTRGENGDGERKRRDGVTRFSVDWTRVVHFQFQEMTLRDALAIQAKMNRFAFFLDRRVDPEILVTCSADDVPLAAAMTEMIDGVGLDSVILGPLLYVGPPESGGELLLTLALPRESGGPTGNEAVGKLENRTAPLSEDFVDPETILKDAAKKAGLSWSGLDQMPFDYWQCGPLPSMKTGDLFSLVLIGFGVDYRLDERKPILKPVAFSREAVVSRQWSADETASLARGDFPSVEWQDVRKEVHATGPFREMATIEYLVARLRMASVTQEAQRQRDEKKESADSDDAPRLKPNRSGDRVISGEIRQATLGYVFDQLRDQLGVEAVLDPSVDSLGISLETRITCQFRDANSKQALREIADRLGVSVRITGSKAVFYKKKGK